MKEELALFYKIWNFPINTNLTNISREQLGIFFGNAIRNTEAMQNLKKNIKAITIVLILITIWKPVVGLTISTIIALAIFCFNHSKKDKALATINSGISAFNEGRYEEALEIFQNIKKNMYYDADFYSWIYYCYYNMGNYQEALEFLEKSFPKGVRVKHLQCLFAMGENQKILDYINSKYFQLEINNRPSILALIGSILIKIGYPDVALQKLSVYRIETKKINEDNCAFLYTLAKCYEQLGKPEMAEEQYRLIRAFKPGFMDMVPENKSL